MTAPGGMDSNLPSLSQRLLAYFSCLVATTTSVLLWGVGAEAMHFGHQLTGALLLTDAGLVTALEAATLFFLVLPRNSCIRCRWVECLPVGLDTYKRAVLYALLTVTCFVRLDKYWLPVVPGCALILTTLLYMLKHCCRQRVTSYDMGKMPSSFVSFDNSASLMPDVSQSSSLENTLEQQQQQRRQLQLPSLLSLPIVTVGSADNDYLQGPNEGEAPVPAILVPPALPPRRQRPSRSPAAPTASPDQRLISEHCPGGWAAQA